MTKGGKGLAVALIASMLLPLLLSACGSSDSGSSTTETSEPAANSSQGLSASAEGSSKTPGPAQGKSSQGNKRADQSQKSDSGFHSVAAPLKVSGGGSAQVRGKGGDNSVQNYGEESDEDELRAAAEAVHGFYVARAEGEWAKACDYLSSSAVRQLEGVGEQASPGLKDNRCSSVLETFTNELPPAAARETTVVDAVSLRNGDERSFLIYYGAKHALYAMSLVNEDGEWKPALLVGTPLG